jgi:hypothetical protein
VLQAALAIHTVEARHASWIRGIAGEPEAPQAFDRPLTRTAVLRAVAGTRFIQAAPRRRARRRPAGGGGTTPRFTG